MLRTLITIEYIEEIGIALMVPANCISPVIWNNGGLMGLIPREAMENGRSLCKDTKSDKFCVYWEEVLRLEPAQIILLANYSATSH